MSTGTPPSEAHLAELEALIVTWLDEQLADNPVVAEYSRDPEGRRWRVRMLGEDKDVSTVWFWLDQRTLHYETYVMPAPEENEAAFYAHLLHRNAKLYGMAFNIGAEDAVYLSGQLGNEAVTPSELDRILGTFYATIELCFRSALRIGFASRFA